MDSWTYCYNAGMVKSRNIEFFFIILLYELQDLVHDSLSLNVVFPGPQFPKYVKWNASCIWGVPAIPAARCTTKAARKRKSHPSLSRHRKNIARLWRISWQGFDARESGQKLESNDDVTSGEAPNHPGGDCKVGCTIRIPPQQPKLILVVIHIFILNLQAWEVATSCRKD